MPSEARVAAVSPYRVLSLSIADAAPHQVMAAHLSSKSTPVNAPGTVVKGVPCTTEDFEPQSADDTSIAPVWVLTSVDVLLTMCSWQWAEPTAEELAEEIEAAGVPLVATPFVRC